MSQFFYIHDENPQHRLLKQAAEIIRGGGVIAYPTDSTYALGCHLGDKAAVDRIRRIRGLDDKHYLSLVCRDLSDLGTYAKVDNQSFRLLKNYTPGPYTFILEATREIPKRFVHPKRKTIGLRVPDHIITQSLLAELGEPLMSTTLQLPGDEYPMIDPSEIRERLSNQVDLILAGGFCGLEPTSIIEFVRGEPVILREGKGDIKPFLTQPA